MKSKEKRFDSLVDVIREFEDMKREKKKDPCAYAMSLEDIQYQIDWLYSLMRKHIPRSHFSEIWLMVKRVGVDFPRRI